MGKFEYNGRADEVKRGQLVHTYILSNINVSDYNLSVCLSVCLFVSHDRRVTLLDFRNYSTYRPENLQDGSVFDCDHRQKTEIA